MVLGFDPGRVVSGIFSLLAHHRRSAGLFASFGGVAESEEHLCERNHFGGYAVSGTVLPQRKPRRRAIYGPCSGFDQCPDSYRRCTILPAHGRRFQVHVPRDTQTGTCRRRKYNHPAVGKTPLVTAGKQYLRTRDAETHRMGDCHKVRAAIQQRRDSADVPQPVRFSVQRGRYSVRLASLFLDHAFESEDRRSGDVSGNVQEPFSL